MKQIMMMVTVALFSSATVSAQNRSADVSEVKFADTVVRLTADSGAINLQEYPIKETYTFSNAKHVNVRLSVWIPGSDYAYEIFGINANQATNTNINTIAIDAVQDRITAVNPNGILRATPSLITVTPPAFRDPPEIFSGQSDSDLDLYIGILNGKNSIPIWTSDIQSFDAGTDNVAEFIWDGYSNRDGIRRLAEDQSAFYVLEDADTGAMLNVLYYATFAISAAGTRAVDSNEVSENMVASRNMPIIAQFILSDGHCNFLPYGALDGGVQGVMDFLNSECFLGDGVLAYATTGNSAIDGVAAATQKTFDATIKANEVSSFTWQPVPGSHHSDLKVLPAGTYYIMTVIWQSLDPDEYVVGQGTPLFFALWDQRVFPQDMVLGKISTGMENPAVNEVTVIWKDDAPYFAVNGQEIKAEVYDLTGKKVQIVENSKFYIVQARTAEGRTYAQIVIR